MTSMTPEPGAPDNLTRYTSSDADTRRLIETILKREYRRERERYWLNLLGLASGLVVALSFLGVSAWLIDGGHDAAGTILGTVDIVALVGTFVYAHRWTRQIESQTMPPPRP